MPGEIREEKIEDEGEFLGSGKNASENLITRIFSGGNLHGLGRGPGSIG